MGKMKPGLVFIYVWIYFTFATVFAQGGAHSTDVCGTLFYNSETGIITSPNFPRLYPANVRCVWVLDATLGHVLTVYLTYLNVQNKTGCDADYVRISDGKSVERRFCGSGTREQLISGSRRLLVEFVSDSSIEFRGFRLQFLRIPLEPSGPFFCSGIEPSSFSGTILMPRFPSLVYSLNVFCSWRIQVPSRHKVLLRFTALNLEISTGCMNDYVAITDSSTQLGPFCNGTTLPADYISESSAVNVFFYSDSTIPSVGFRIEWEILPEFCGFFPRTLLNGMRCPNETRRTRSATHCPSNQIQNGLTSCSTGQRIGSICQFQCEENFLLTSSSSSRCIPLGVWGARWFPPLPNCLGEPVPFQLPNSGVVPRNNRVTFSCIFIGFPLPVIEWKFENGTSLPQNSQFQILPQQNISLYQSSRELTVYGMSCRDTSLLRFRCSATNIHTSTPVKSSIFSVDIDLSHILLFESAFDCEDAQLICRERGGSLLVVPNLNSMNMINMKTTMVASYWISSLSHDLVEDWEQEPGFVSANPGGCIKVAQGAWARDQTSPSFFYCDTRPPPPRTTVSAQADRCRGDILHVRWNPLPGAESLPHFIFVSEENRLLVSPGVTSLTVNNLTGNTRYDVQVVPMFEGCPATRPATDGSLRVSTSSVALTPVQDVSSRSYPSLNTCIISWQSQSALQNGLSHYQISLSKLPAQRRNIGNISNAETQNFRLSPSTKQYAIDSLEPNTKYDVEITSVLAPPCDTEVTVFPSSRFHDICITNPAVPDFIPLSKQTPIVKDNQVVISLSPIDEQKGSISCYVVVIQRNLSDSTQVNLLDLTRLRPAGDSAGNDSSFIAFVTSRMDSPTELTLGDDSLTCCDATVYDSSSNCSQNFRKRRASLSLIRAQNRPLRVGEIYNYYVIATVPSGNSVLLASSNVSVTFQPPRSNNFGIINSGGVYFETWVLVVIVAAAILLIVGLITAICICKRNNHGKKKTRTENSTVVTIAETENASFVGQLSSAGHPEPAYCEPFVQFTAKEYEYYSIPKADLTSAYLKKSAENNLIFKKEFKRILTAFPSPLTKYARQPECKDKNRSEEYLPSDQSRVQLESIGSGWGSDYINASFIDGFTSHRAYIAAQGPMEHTVQDFWKMVVENRCTRIVMMTRLIENKRAKCESYWADVGKKEDFGNITVTTKSVRNIGHCIKREFVVKPKEHPKSFVVTQFQFMTWPDHDVPSTTSPILRFREAILAERTDETILVHGGVGGGRTGTFLAFLILCEQLNQCSEINAIETVKKLRDARTGMVENLKQYIFIHKLLCEVSLLPPTECLASEFPKYFKRMKDVNGSHTTNMKTEFDQLETLTILHDEPDIASRKSLKSSIKPYKRSGVSTDHVLMQKRKKAINSLHLSVIQTYNPDVYFLTAQSPSRSKLQAFWNCILEFQIPCVIRIEEKEKCSENFFIGDGDRYAFDDVSVSLAKTEQHFGYTEKSFKVYKGGSLTPLCVQQIELTSWPVNGFPVNFHTVVSVASRVKNYRPFQTNLKEISSKKYLALILCSDGSTRCGAFCAIFDLLDRLEREARVDVFREVKDLRDCRSKMVGNIYQYEFVYQTIAQYIQEFNPYQELH